jgi:hypothetical protein
VSSEILLPVRLLVNILLFKEENKTTGQNIQKETQANLVKVIRNEPSKVHRGKEICIRKMHTVMQHFAKGNAP